MMNRDDPKLAVPTAEAAAVRHCFGSQLQASRDLMLDQVGRERAALGQSEAELAQVRAALAEVLASRPYRLSIALRDALSSWQGLKSLPAALLSLRRPTLPPALIPEMSSVDAPMAVRAVPRAAGSLRIAAIVDEFTALGMAPDCDLLLITPGNALAELDAFRPDLLLVESAWQGNGGLWRNELVPPGMALAEVLAWCGAHGVPSVFWNKEDPSHFDHFLPLARHFDHIYTTAAEAVPRYRAALARDAVDMLPFACQPYWHHPIETTIREDAFVFAGSHYARYPERAADFARLVDHVEGIARVDIFDRNHGSGLEEFEFPERFQPLIRGVLAGDAVASKCKEYRFALNLNSISHSPTMFSRRVLELMASNTVVVSNPSVGMQRLLGDLVVRETEDGFRPEGVLEGDTPRYRKYRLAALRKVLSEHTWRHRLDRLAMQVLGRDPVPGVKVTVVAAVADAGAARSVVSAFEAQRQIGVRLILVGDATRVDPAVAARAEQWLDEAQARELRPGSVWAEDHVAVFVPGDHYGANYLVDLVLGLSFCPLPALGKAAFHCGRSGKPVLCNDGAQYRPSRELPVAAALVRADAIGMDLWSWLEKAGSGGYVDAPGMALDEFNYCRAATADPCDVDDLAGLDAGLPLEVFLDATVIAPVATKPEP